MSDNLVLQPGQTIRPNVDQETAINLIRDHFGFTVNRIKSLVSYDDVNYYVEAKKDDEEVYRPFVFKVLNSMDTQKPGHIQAENDVMLILSSKGINCSVPQKTVKNEIYSLIDLPGEEGIIKTHLIRLLTFVPGTITCDTNLSENLLFQAGEYIARIEEYLKDFSHPGLDNHDSIWFLTSTPRLKKFLYVLDSQPERKQLVEDVLAAYESRIVPAIPKLDKGFVHGDYNEQNIVCQKSEERPGEFDIFGIIDFGDSHIGQYAFELAITMCYMMLECIKTKGTTKLDPLEGGGHALAGYAKVRKVSQFEFDLLRVAIASRLCQSLVVGAYTNSQDPSNTYVLTTAKSGWALLEKIWRETTQEQLQAIWTRVLDSYNTKIN